jgi:FkbM family methyltransferase
MKKSKSPRDIAKRTINGLFGKLGLEIVSESRWGKSPYHDIAVIRGDRPTRMIFDVGANVGQTIKTLRPAFPEANIHAFEPYPPTYERLKSFVANDPHVETHNVALGAEQSTVTMYLAERDVGNSLLPLRSDLPVERIEDCFRPAGSTTVPVTRLDQFCRERNIEVIDILKIDTQGFEIHVLEGAGEMLRPEQIGAVYFEANFERFYEGQSRFTDLVLMLTNRGYRLVDFYSKSRHQQGHLRWCDCLFV